MNKNNVNLNSEKRTDLYTFYFLGFCIIGWIYEVVLEFHYGNGFVNRGFLFGPYLPIYGFGALIIITILMGIVKKPKYIWKIPITPFLIFFLVMVIATVIEYAASVVMELLFDQRWWDYSADRYNINGRVCLRTSSRFGLGGVFFLYACVPLFSKIHSRIPSQYHRIITVGIITVVSVDFLITLFFMLQ